MSSNAENWLGDQLCASHSDETRLRLLNFEGEEGVGGGNVSAHFAGLC